MNVCKSMTKECGNEINFVNCLPSDDIILVYLIPLFLHIYEMYSFIVCLRLCGKRLLNQPAVSHVYVKMCSLYVELQGFQLQQIFPVETVTSRRTVIGVARIVVRA